MLIWLRRRPPDSPWSPRQAHIDPLQHLAILRIIDLQHHLRAAGMGMLEPLCTRPAYGALAAGLGHEVFPFLCRPRLEERARPLQMLSE